MPVPRSRDRERDRAHGRRGPSQRHGPIGRGELQGVVHEVRQDLGEATGVDHHRRGRAVDRRRATRPASSPNVFTKEFTKGSSLDRDGLERELAGFDAGDHEQVVDQLDQTSVCVITMSRYSRVSSGDSSVTAAADMSTKPRIPASGVRSSWLVTATKSDFIWSSSRSRLTVASWSARRRADSRTRPSWSASRSSSSRRPSPVPAIGDALVDRAHDLAPGAHRRDEIGAVGDRRALLGGGRDRARGGGEPVAAQVPGVADDAHRVVDRLPGRTRPADEQPERRAAELAGDRVGGAPEVLAQLPGAGSASTVAWNSRDLRRGPVVALGGGLARSAADSASRARSPRLGRGATEEGGEGPDHDADDDAIPPRNASTAHEGASAGSVARRYSLLPQLARDEGRRADQAPRESPAGGALERQQVPETQTDRRARR